MSRAQEQQGRASSSTVTQAIAGYHINIFHPEADYREDREHGEICYAGTGTPPPLMMIT